MSSAPVFPGCISLNVLLGYIFMGTVICAQLRSVGMDASSRRHLCVQNEEMTSLLSLQSGALATKSKHIALHHIRVGERSKRVSTQRLGIQRERDKGPRSKHVA